MCLRQPVCGCNYLTVDQGPLSIPGTDTCALADAVPKRVATRLLRPALAELPEVKLLCREGRPDQLVAELALHHLDMLLLDSPLDASLPVRAHSHPLAEWPLAFFGEPDLTAERAAGLPRSLESAPLLVPTAGSAIRRQVDRFFEATTVALARGFTPGTVATARPRPSCGRSSTTSSAA